MAEDSSDSGMMEGIREDGEYFRRLLTLVPYLVSDEVTQEPQDNPDGTDGPPSKKKKKKQKQRQKTEGSIPKGLAAQQNDSSQGVARRGKKRPAVDVEESDEEETSGVTLDVDSAPHLPPKKKQKKEKSKPKEKKVPLTNSSQALKKQQKEREKKQQQQRVSKSMADAINGSSHPVEDEGSASREELRQKLHSKVQEARAKKGLTSTTEQGGENQKKKKDKKKKKKKDKQKQEKGKGKKPQGEEKMMTETVPEAPAAKKPLFNIRGSLMFNKLSFDNSGEKGKAGRSELVGKDYKRILQKLESRKNKVSKLKEKDQSMAMALEDKLAWKDAVSKAAGFKVKDDEALVKRSLKRKMKIKDKRKQKWRDRQKTVRKNVEEKQAKRERNIEARKESKKQKKYKKMVKKGRIVPGMNN